VGDPQRAVWEALERIYWMSALALGVVAFGLELALGSAPLTLLGGLYLAITLFFYLGPRRIVLHLLYAVASTLVMLRVVPELPLAGDSRDFAAAILVLATLALGTYGGPLWAGLGALAVAAFFPGPGPYQRVALLGVHALAGYLGVRIRGWIGELARVQARLDWIAHHDPLTGLGNRRSLEAAFLEGGWRYLSLWDLDQLKRINDEQGHAAGDAELVRFSRVLASESRSTDRFFRTGGDEFVGLHRDAAPPQGLVDRVRRRFPAVSVGFVPLVGGLEAAIAEADRAMYRDKARRRSAG